MARPVLPRPGLAVRAAALHPAPLRVSPGLAELPDFSRDRLRAPPSPRVFPGLAAGPATLLLPSPAPPRPAPPLWFVRPAQVARLFVSWNRAVSASSAFGFRSLEGGRPAGPRA
nr:putative uncharacterized protein DANCR [Macaca fascicularis]